MKKILYQAVTYRERKGREKKKTEIPNFSLRFSSRAVEAPLYN